MKNIFYFFFFFSSRRRHTRSLRDWSSDVCSSDLYRGAPLERRESRETSRPPGAWARVRRRPMKELIKQYLDHGMSRRQLMTGLSALGMSTAAVKSVAQSLETFGQGAPPAPAMRTMKGTGGALFVQQLKAAGVEHIFFNPSTGDYPIFDALVDEPAIHLIKGIHEGAVVAMADGYARASGKTGVVIVANIGLPNAMTQMVNSWKDQIPILVAVASVEQDALGRDLP